MNWAEIVDIETHHARPECASVPIKLLCVKCVRFKTRYYEKPLRPETESVLKFLRNKARCLYFWEIRNDTKISSQNLGPMLAQLYYRGLIRRKISGSGKFLYWALAATD